MQRRRRGVILTAQGQQKLQSAITELEQTEKLGQKITLEELAEKTGLDPGTVAKVLEREKGCDRKTLDRFFRSLSLELTDADYTKPGTVSVPNPVPESSDHQLKTPVDWGEAVDVSIFYGRTEELATLQEWILQDRCRLILIQGMGGIGKTALSIKLSENIYEEFDYCIWRSLREAPPVEKILADLIKFLSNQQDVNLPKTVGDAVTRLIHYLNESRCLLVLDNAESILQGGVNTGQYLEGYEGYGTLISRVGESRHQSCLIVTSREKPKRLERNEGLNRPVRTLSLNGLDSIAGYDFLKAEGLKGDATQWNQIIGHYSGNPLALKIIVNTARNLFEGRLEILSNENFGLLGDIQDLLESQFARLSVLEKSVMYWLAINREATSLKVLREDLLASISESNLLEVLSSLKKRSLIERGISGFTLQNVLMEYVTEKFVSRLLEELKTCDLSIFKTHAILKATAKDYVRETQLRLIVNPILVHITAKNKNIEPYMKAIRANTELFDNYAAGNFLNLVCQNQLDNCYSDFSALTLRQVYLKGITSHPLDLSHSALIDCYFLQTFGLIQQVRFSPNGEIIASGDSKNNIQLWNLKNRELIATLQGHSAWVRSISFSPDNELLASSSEDNMIRVWQLSDYRCIHCFQGHTNHVWSLDFSPCGNFLVSGGGDSLVKLWNIHDGQCCHLFEGHEHWVWSVAFSSDGKLLASGSGDSTIRLWDVQKHSLLAILIGHSRDVASIAFSPDDKLIASGGFDGKVRLWDIQQEKCILELEGHTNWIRTLAFSPDGNFLVSGSEDRTIRIWNLSTQQCLSAIEDHINEVRSLAFSPDGSFLASSGGDLTIRIWDFHKRQCVQTFAGYTNKVWSTDFSSDSKYMVSGSEDTVIRLWDLQKRQFMYSFEGHNHRIYTVRFSPDDKMIASGGGDFSIRLWNIQTRECIHVLKEHTNEVRSIAFSPDGQFLISGSEDYTIRLWNIQRGKCLKISEEQEHWIVALNFSPNGKMFAAGLADGKVQVWDAQQHKCIHVFEGHESVVWSVAFSSDNKTLISSSEDTSIRLWNIQKRDCYYIFDEYSQLVQSMMFRPNGKNYGKLFWENTSDYSKENFKVQQSQYFRIFEREDYSIFSVSLNSDGQILASGHNDGGIKIWEVSTGNNLASFTIPRPYEGTNITGVKGLTDAQRTSMIILGAIDENELLENVT
ncbi:hypothetical protein IXB50_13570 [Leptothoe spongobia TAU-MAC 1115]|uniref:NB-ARC domain-containing protein n=2 Tax=Leptothoe TaxID=2651725 RepID=A0A947DHI2_9CYAN|nr:hypothetical protein [Leptothoe spongobia TAU-MAC 1115]